MAWLSRRVPDEMQALARRRLGDLTRPRSRPEAPLTDPAPVAGAPPAVQGRTGRLADDLVARLPATVRDGRVAVSRAAATGLAVLAAGAIVLAGSYAWRARSVEAVLPADPGASSGSNAAGSAGSTPWVSTSASPASPTGVVVIDVAGKVRTPGVVRLPLGSRVVDAIAAAGGVRGDVDLTTLNLARVLADGEQVLVGVAGGLPVSGDRPAAPGVGPDAVIDLNSATLEQLDTLPGVGPVLAARILDWRTAHGRFSRIDELREVSGIGDARFADLSTRVRV